MAVRTLSSPLISPKKSKKGGGGGGGGRILISVTFLGSAGPIRFLVNEEDLVAAVIQTALKNYAREGRLPVLGSDLNGFLLYCANSGYDALSPWEQIGTHGSRNRNFVLCKKQEREGESKGTSLELGKKGSGSWKAWINKSCGFGIPSF